jgi:hypothetical protein
MGRASSTVQRMKSQDVEPLQLHTCISGFSCCGIEPFGNSEESRYFRTVSALTYLSNHPSGTYLKPFHLHHTNPQLKDLNKVIQRLTKSSMVAEASAEASTQGLLEAMIPSLECYY